MKELSREARGVRASTTLAIDAMFKQMRSEGQDVIGFAAGEPDFNTPEHIKEAAMRAIQENYTRYTPASGALDLKKAVCHRMKEDCGVEYGTNEVVISSGAKHLVYLALQVLVDPEDEVILPTPAWVSYYEMIRMVGGSPVTVPAAEEEGFKLSPEKLEAAITPRTKCVILNNPSNPTGMVYDESQLRALTDVCVKHDLYIIADEIYYGLVYDGKPFTSITALGDDVRDRTILINGVSKSYAMTGWRIGYALARPEITKVMSNYISHSTGSPCSISQRAAMEGLTESQDEVLAMKGAFQARRDYIVSRIQAMPYVSCIRPEGAFYVMMNIKKLIGHTIGGVRIETADDFCDAFLKQVGVAVVSGDGFEAPGFVRWSYAASMEHLEEGLNRLEKFLARVDQ